LPDRKEIILKYRHFISSRYTLYGLIAGFLWFTGAVLMAWLNPLPGHIYITSGMIGLGLGFLWYIFNHRYQMLIYFNQRHDDPFDRLEKYLVEKKQRWDNTQLIRFGLMALLLLTMLTLLIFFKETPWAGIASTLFVALILATIIKGWLDFNDGILLQDIRHHLRDHTSE
jgi:hypothetical protein